MSAISITTILLLTISAVALINAVPAVKRSVWTGGVISRTGQYGQCYELPPKISKYCGYNTTFIKFPRLADDMEALENQFNDWEGLLNTSCSSHIGTLLCFHYFPFAPCNTSTPFDTLKHQNGTPIIILPCKETCIAAKTQSCLNIIGHQSACTQSEWVEHIDCENMPTDKRLCAHLPITNTFEAVRPVPALTDGSTTACPPTTKPAMTEPPSPMIIDIHDPADGMCYELPTDIKNFCGYSTTFLSFPHSRIPLMEPSFEALTDQFLQWIKLLNTGCSDYTGTLLCFHYFPLAKCDINNPVLPPVGGKEFIILPCKEACLNAKNSPCTDLIEPLSDCAVTEWAEHTNCDNFPSVTDTDICSNLPITRTFNGLPPMVPEEVICSLPTPKPPTPEEPSFPTIVQRSCPSSKQCRYRNSFSGKTFQKNSYSYAVKVRVTESIGNNRYAATVIKNYAIETCNSATNMLEGPPEVLGTVTIDLAHAHCDSRDGNKRPNLTPTATFLIAGEDYEQNPDGSFVLTIDCRNRPLVSPCVEGSSDAKLLAAVATGNKVRSSKCTADN